MAQNEILAGRFNAILDKLLSMKTGAPAPILSPEIIPAIVLESDRPEWDFLGGGRRFGFVQFCATTATDRANFVLTNPANSGVLAVVEAFTWAGRTGTQQAYIFALAALAATANKGLSMDSRNFTGSSCSVNVTPGAVGVPAGAAVWCVSQTANVQVDSNPNWKYVLSPGFALALLNSTPNEEMAVSMNWRERALDPSETR